MAKYSGRIPVPLIRMSGRGCCGGDYRKGLKQRKQDRRDNTKKGKLRLGTWNVRTMLQGGKLENLKEEMRENNLDLLGICEVRWAGSGELRSDEYRIFYSGNEKGGHNGVGIILGKRLKEKVMRVEFVDDRLMMIRLKGKEKDLVVIQTYAPTTSHTTDEVEENYDKIEEIIDREKRGACIMVLGDFNAVVGEGQEGNVVGKYGLGERV